MFRDQLGSVRGVVEGTDWVERSVYRSFGQTEEWEDPDPSVEHESHNYIGERRDETGLMYLNARYYDPALGHFLSPDWFLVTDPGVGVHRYAYAGFDPVNRLDPNGNLWDTIWDVGSVVYGIGSAAVNAWNGDYDEAKADLLGAAIDAGAALLPFAPAPGAAANVTRRATTRTVANGMQFSNDTRRQLREIGQLRDGQQVHHIAGASGQASAPIRRILEDAGIPLSSVDNGVGLTYHGGRHADEYSAAVLRRLRDLDDPDLIRNELRQIRSELREIDDALANGTREVTTRTNRDGAPDTIREWLNDNR